MTLDVGSEDERRFEMTTTHLLCADNLTKMETIQDGIGSSMNE